MPKPVYDYDLSVFCYTVASRTLGFALEQPFHVVALACSASGILKQLEYKVARERPVLEIP
ncbi:MAG: hypothetical protein LBJ00_10405 [Planctomycetaceae bacterium]|jgi:ribosomal protein L30E|nr:hypothetical protein [Planctomycetaceae bacterium]